MRFWATKKSSSVEPSFLDQLQEVVERRAAISPAPSRPKWRKAVGVWRHHTVYEDDPDLSMLKYSVDYIPIYTLDGLDYDIHCDYCGRKVEGDECKGCGAPSK